MMLLELVAVDSDPDALPAVELLVDGVVADGVVLPLVPVDGVTEADPEPDRFVLPLRLPVPLCVPVPLVLPLRLVLPETPPLPETLLDAVCAITPVAKRPASRTPNSLLMFMLLI